MLDYEEIVTSLLVCFISYSQIIALSLLVCHFHCLCDFGHGSPRHLLWFFDFELSVTGLEINKGVGVRELVANLKIESKVFLDLKEFHVASFLG
jgi:hypothetical protein